MDLGKFLHSLIGGVASGTHTVEQVVGHPVMQMLQQMYALHNAPARMVPNDPNPPSHVAPGGSGRPGALGLGGKLAPIQAAPPVQHLPFIPHITNLPDYTTVPRNFGQMFDQPTVRGDQPILPHYFSHPVWKIPTAIPPDPTVQRRVI